MIDDYNMRHCDHRSVIRSGKRAWQPVVWTERLTQTVTSLPRAHFPSLLHTFMVHSSLQLRSPHVFIFLFAAPGSLSPQSLH